MTRCLLLTTDTRHHRYFASRLASCAQVTVVLEETRPGHRRSSGFERLQDRFEQQSFNGSSERFEASGGLHRFQSGNQPECRELIRRTEPDLLITFGTGKIAPDVYRLGRFSVNVHRGILPDYRGLDSDLWALYRGDFENIGATIHLLEERLDTGPIVMQRRLQVQPGMQASHMRYYTTVLAADIMERIVKELQQGNPLSATPQNLSQGTYLSAIPRLKRWVAARRLERHAKGLAHA